MKSAVSNNVVRVLLASALLAAGVPAAQAEEKGLPDCRSVSYKIEVSEATPACQLPLDMAKAGAMGPIRSDEPTTSAETMKGEQDQERLFREFPGNTLTN